MRIVKGILHWFDLRLGYSEHIDSIIRHPVPPKVASGKTSWMYVFGNATLVAFVLQVLTGAALATKYIPSTAHAYDSLMFITYDLPWGGFLRAMHLYGASAMVVLILIHMARVFLMGSYKFPREMSWLSGVALLILTLGMAWTGQLLRFDENGVWSVVVASQIAGRTPFIGPWLAQFILAGETVGGTTLSRFFLFHVFLLPISIFGIVGLHIYLILYHGVSEPPEAGRPVDPKTYKQWYEEMLEKHGKPYFPDVTAKEAAFGVGMIVVVVLLALILGPRGPNMPPDPTQLAADPRPDWFFLWLYALVAYKPANIETLVLVYAPLLILFAMIVLPFVANHGERSPIRRPWAIGIVAVAGILLVVLTGAGNKASFVPDFATEPVGAEVIPIASGPVFEGAMLFHERGCQYCHAVAGQGGNYGPDLTDIVRRLPAKEFTLRTITGIGDMPPYRDKITLEELNLIIAFLEAVGPEGQVETAQD